MSTGSRSCDRKKNITKDIPRWISETDKKEVKFFRKGWGVYVRKKMFVSLARRIRPVSEKRVVFSVRRAGWICLAAGTDLSGGGDGFVSRERRLQEREKVKREKTKRLSILRNKLNNACLNFNFKAMEF